MVVPRPGKRAAIKPSPHASYHASLVVHLRLALCHSTGGIRPWKGQERVGRHSREVARDGLDVDERKLSVGSSDPEALSS